MIRQMILVAALVLCVSAFSGELKPASRPFLIWNQSDLDLIRVRQSETWMQDSMKRAANERNGGEFFQLFQAALGDEKAKNWVKGYVIGFIGTKPDSRPWSDNWLVAIGVDIVYHELTDQQKSDFYTTYQEHLERENNDTKVYTKDSWRIHW